MSGEKRVLKVLLVEDDPGDVELTRIAFETTSMSVDLEVAADGLEALDRISAGLLNYTVPDLILLDLNLPRMDGVELLERIKGDERLTTIPVVVLSTSDAPEDIRRTYQAGANSFITKPTGFTEFVETAKQIKSYWFALAKLPDLDQTVEAIRQQPQQVMWVFTNGADADVTTEESTNRASKPFSSGVQETR